jgi:preprotein translocase subunit SecG
MTSTLIIVQIILAVLISIAVLMQKSSSIGLGAYSGSNDSLFGAKGPVSFLQKATFVLGLLFVINTLTLVYLYNSQKVVEFDLTKKVEVDKSSSTAPKTPVVPSAPVK